MLAQVRTRARRHLARGAIGNRATNPTESHPPTIGAKRRSARTSPRSANHPASRPIPRPARPRHTPFPPSTP